MEYLKNEIIESGYVSIKQFKQQIVLKASKYKQTKRAKRIIYRKTKQVDVFGRYIGIINYEIYIMD